MNKAKQLLACFSNQKSLYWCLNEHEENYIKILPQSYLFFSLCSLLSRLDTTQQ